MDNPCDLFRRWFVAPIELIEKTLPNGDGAFVALMSTLPLYERAIIGELKLGGEKATNEDVGQRVEADLKIDTGTRTKFWAIYRNGFMHQGMGLDGKSKWQISEKYNVSPEIRTVDGVDYVCLNPWKFAHHTLSKFMDRPELITASESFPFASIFQGS
jgi:hypothetical protein